MDNDFLKEIELAAEKCTKLIEKDIDTEKGFIKKAHNFERKIIDMDQIFAHLISHAHEHTDFKILNEFMQNLGCKINYLKRLLSEKIEYELHFIEEEQDLINELDDEIEHREWRAAWKTAQKVADEEMGELKVDLNFLESLISQIKEILISINDEKFVVLQETQVSIKPEKIGTKALKHFSSFLNKIYKFFNFYNNVFENMIKKEKTFLNKEYTRDT